VSDANGRIEFTNISVKAAPPRGSIMFLAIGPGSQNSLLPANYYSGFYDPVVNNAVKKVVVNGHPSTLAMAPPAVTSLDEDITLVVHILALDENGNGVSGQLAGVDMTQLPPTLWYINYNDGQSQITESATTITAVYVAGAPPMLCF